MPKIAIIDCLITDGVTKNRVDQWGTTITFYNLQRPLVVLVLNSVDYSGVLQVFESSFGGVRMNFEFLLSLENR